MNTTTRLCDEKGPLKVMIFRVGDRYHSVSKARVCLCTVQSVTESRWVQINQYVFNILYEFNVQYTRLTLLIYSSMLM